jgi:hypothetical protein
MRKMGPIRHIRQCPSHLLKGFTSFDDPYEVPPGPKLRIDTTCITLKEEAREVMRCSAAGNLSNRGQDRDMLMKNPVFIIVCAAGGVAADAGIGLSLGSERDPDPGAPGRVCAGGGGVATPGEDGSGLARDLA